MCFMVLSFLINLIPHSRVALICLIDLTWGICNDHVLLSHLSIKHFYYKYKK